MEAGMPVTILGATGSVGRSAIAVCEAMGLRVTALAGRRDAAGMEELVRRVRPGFVGMEDEAAAQDLRARLRDVPTTIWSGEGAVNMIAGQPYAGIVLNAIVGIAGLAPTMAALYAGHPVALANKETLVTAGTLVMTRAAEKGIPILPVDSEHSAIFQCLQGEKRRVKELLLTASGGPFWGYSAEQLKTVTREQALCHPNWKMGPKITVDSATMMNKGFELIEAVHLFGVAPEQVRILVHRQSVVHSMVRFEDNSVIAQMAAPDMRLPIQVALTWPDGGAACVEELDFCSIPALTFAPMDDKTFPAVSLAREAIRKGGTLPAILNGANEHAVAAFLAGEIPFHRIVPLVEMACGAVKWVGNPVLDQIYEADILAREAVEREMRG